MRTLSAVFLVLILSSVSAYANRDSIGVKSVGGKLYILHRVAKGEGLYSIGRRYNVSIPNIEEADPTVKDGMDPGDIVMVPSWKRGTFKTGNNTPSPKPKVEVKPVPKPVVANSGTDSQKPVSSVKEPQYYVVRQGETLFTIAKKNNTSVIDIQKWNGLKDNSISAGQKLIVGYTGEVQTKENAVQVQDLGPEGSDKNSGLKEDHIDQKITKEYEDAQKKLEAERKKGKPEMKEVNESGVATWIDDGSVVSEKKLALHRTAPPGTIIQLTNPRNGKRVFVKVIGKLPESVDEQNVTIKVTKNTAEDLGAIDKFFRVEMNYGIEVYNTSRK